MDAFNDVLRGGCGEVEPFDKIFVWKGHQQAMLALGDSYFNEIIQLFSEANVDEDEGTVGVLNPVTGERDNNLRIGIVKLVLVRYSLWGFVGFSSISTGCRAFSCICLH